MLIDLIHGGKMSQILRIILYIHIYVLLYLFVVFLELISFYITGFNNNGRFPTRLSFLRKALTTFLNIILAIFLFMYYAMFWLIMTWSLLGAILNPSKFLPYATSVLTLFAVISAKIAMLRTQIL